MPDFMANGVSYIKIKSKIAVGVMLLFICVCAFLGETLKLYDTIWWWDIMLHTVSGVTFALIGFMLVKKLSKNTAAPLLAALFAFSLSVTAGVLWEIYEFIMDSIRQTNMQRWMFMPTPDSDAWRAAVGYRGSGLIDTMKDLIVGMGSALITAAIGYRYLKKKEKKEP